MNKQMQCESSIKDAAENLQDFFIDYTMPSSDFFSTLNRERIFSKPSINSRKSNINVAGHPRNPLASPKHSLSLTQGAITSTYFPSSNYYLNNNSHNDPNKNNQGFKDPTYSHCQVSKVHSVPLNALNLSEINNATISNDVNVLPSHISCLDDSNIKNTKNITNHKSSHSIPASQPVAENLILKGPTNSVPLRTNHIYDVPFNIPVYLSNKGMVCQLSSCTDTDESSCDTSKFFSCGGFGIPTTSISDFSPKLNFVKNKLSRLSFKETFLNLSGNNAHQSSFKQGKSMSVSSNVALPHHSHGQEITSLPNENNGINLHDLSTIKSSSISSSVSSSMTSLPAVPSSTTPTYNLLTPDFMSNAAAGIVQNNSPFPNAKQLLIFPFRSDSKRRNKSAIKFSELPTLLKLSGRTTKQHLMSLVGAAGNTGGNLFTSRPHAPNISPLLSSQVPLQSREELEECSYLNRDNRHRSNSADDVNLQQQQQCRFRHWQQRPSPIIKYGNGGKGDKIVRQKGQETQAGHNDNNNLTRGNGRFNDRLNNNVDNVYHPSSNSSLYTANSMAFEEGGYLRSLTNNYFEHLDAQSVVASYVIYLKYLYYYLNYYYWNPSSSSCSYETYCHSATADNNINDHRTNVTTLSPDPTRADIAVGGVVAAHQKMRRQSYKTVFTGASAALAASTLLVTAAGGDTDVIDPDPDPDNDSSGEQTATRRLSDDSQPPLVGQQLPATSLNKNGHPHFLTYNNKRFLLDKCLSSSSPHTFLLDPGDGLSNELVESCAFFRNEIGNGTTDDPDLTSDPIGAQSPPPNFKTNLAATTAAAGISVLDYRKHCPELCDKLVADVNPSTWNGRGDDNRRLIISSPQPPNQYVIENWDNGAYFYRIYFLGKEHWNYFGNDSRYGPIAISLARRVQNPNFTYDNPTEIYESKSVYYDIIIRTNQLCSMKGSVAEEIVPTNHMASAAASGRQQKTSSISQVSRDRKLRAAITHRDVISYACPCINVDCLKLWDVVPLSLNTGPPYSINRRSNGGGSSSHHNTNLATTGVQSFYYPFNPNPNAPSSTSFVLYNANAAAPANHDRIKIEEKLINYDEQLIKRNYKFGVLYCKPGQSTEEEMYNNEITSQYFEDFLSSLGSKVLLKGFDKYKGDLDTKTDSSGLYSLYTTINCNYTNESIYSPVGMASSRKYSFATFNKSRQQSNFVTLKNNSNNNLEFTNSTHLNTENVEADVKVIEADGKVIKADGKVIEADEEISNTTKSASVVNTPTTFPLIKPADLIQIMFHVSTLIPFTPNNKQQVPRKRHIGNDVLTIIFQDPSDLENDMKSLPFSAKRIRSHYQHVFIIVRPTIVNGNKISYKVAISRSKDVEAFGPPLPPNGIFHDLSHLRNYLLIKCINADNSAQKSKKFASIATRGRLEWLKDITLNHSSKISINDVFPNPSSNISNYSIYVPSKTKLDSQISSNSNAFSIFNKLSQMVGSSVMNTVKKRDSNPAPYHPHLPPNYMTTNNVHYISGGRNTTLPLNTTSNNDCMLRRHINQSSSPFQQAPLKPYKIPSGALYWPILLGNNFAVARDGTIITNSSDLNNDNTRVDLIAISLDVVCIIELFEPEYPDGSGISTTAAAKMQLLLERVKTAADATATTTLTPTSATVTADNTQELLPVPCSFTKADTFDPEILTALDIEYPRILFAIPTCSVIGWKLDTEIHNLTIYYNEGDYTILSYSESMIDVNNIIQRLKEVTRGKQVSIFEIHKTSKDSQLGLFIHKEGGYITDIEVGGLAWNIGLRRGYRIVEICGEYVINMAINTVMERFKSLTDLTLIAIPPLIEGKPIRPCYNNLCYLASLHTNINAFTQLSLDPDKRKPTLQSQNSNNYSDTHINKAPTSQCNALAVRDPRDSLITVPFKIMELKDYTGLNTNNNNNNFNHNSRLLPVTKQSELLSSSSAISPAAINCDKTITPAFPSQHLLYKGNNKVKPHLYHPAIYASNVAGRGGDFDSIERIHAGSRNRNDVTSRTFDKQPQHLSYNTYPVLSNVTIPPPTISKYCPPHSSSSLSTIAVLPSNTSFFSPSLLPRGNLNNNNSINPNEVLQINHHNLMTKSCFEPLGLGDSDSRSSLSEGFRGGVTSSRYPGQERYQIYRNSTHKLLQQQQKTVSHHQNHYRTKYNGGAGGGTKNTPPENSPCPLLNNNNSSGKSNNTLDDNNYLESHLRKLINFEDDVIVTSSTTTSKTAISDSCSSRNVVPLNIEYLTTTNTEPVATVKNDLNLLPQVTPSPTKSGEEPDWNYLVERATKIIQMCENGSSDTTKTFESRSNASSYSDYIESNSAIDEISKEIIQNLQDKCRNLESICEKESQSKHNYKTQLRVLLRENKKLKQQLDNLRIKPTET